MISKIAFSGPRPGDRPRLYLREAETTIAADEHWAEDLASVTVWPQSGDLEFATIAATPSPGGVNVTIARHGGGSGGFLRMGIRALDPELDAGHWELSLHGDPSRPPQVTFGGHGRWVLSLTPPADPMAALEAEELALRTRLRLVRQQLGKDGLSDG